jgi:hypothetical protein
MADQMITYEITTTVPADLADAYERYMIERHIPDLLATGSFEGATFSRSSDGRYRIRYEARSRETLDQYLSDHAFRLRQHFADTFPDGIELSREEWEQIRIWERENDFLCNFGDNNARTFSFTF